MAESDICTSMDLSEIDMDEVAGLCDFREGSYAAIGTTSSLGGDQIRSGDRAEYGRISIALMFTPV